ncbi:hypothetical protein [Nostoc sp. ChiQUE01b]|uniref:hypothetical protein n=1 Tax=Nostoc sp. ChiQUE01b TaxID=3075376 RepID=UPI002AD474E2|nr:hypothetical protein [Nostoc sp. ChiQUE01b]MDZ8261703.1 hypothetical protein [Nostoc sp. ChiQUE01b]
MLLQRPQTVKNEQNINLVQHRKDFIRQFLAPAAKFAGDIDRGFLLHQENKVRDAVFHPEFW